MCLYGLVNKLVATQLLKDESLKANRSKPVSTIWTSWTLCYICWVRHVLTLALFFLIIWIKIPDGYQIASLEELGMWSTSQLSLWIRVFTQRSELSFRYLLSKIIRYILYTKYIIYWALSFDITLIFSYMWDLTSWAHIWCVSGFVLKTGCYKVVSEQCWL